MYEVGDIIFFGQPSGWQNSECGLIANITSIHKNYEIIWASAESTMVESAIFINEKSELYTNIFTCGNMNHA